MLLVNLVSRALRADVQSLARSGLAFILRGQVRHGSQKAPSVQDKVMVVYGIRRCCRVLRSAVNAGSPSRKC